MHDRCFPRPVAASPRCQMYIEGGAIHEISKRKKTDCQKIFFEVMSFRVFLGHIGRCLEYTNPLISPMYSC